MAYRLYKPNSKNTGCAASFYLSYDKDADPTCVFLNMVKQYSWNQKKRSGSFAQNAKNPAKTINIKLSINEVGGFIHTLKTGESFSAFHAFGENKTQIKFGTYQKKNGTKAFSLSVVRNSADKFGLGIEPGEGEALLSFLNLCLQTIFLSEMEKLSNKNPKDLGNDPPF